MAENRPRPLMKAAEAYKYYRLGEPSDSLFAPDIDRQLLEQGVARIAMPLTPGDFQQLTDAFDACIAECPDQLAASYHLTEEVRRNNTAGYVRKERKVNDAGKQLEDPKSLIHFTESAQTRWQEQYKTGPKMLRDFLSAGFDVQHILREVTRSHAKELNETHPNFSDVYFPPTQPGSLGFLRVLSYDSYSPIGNEGAVAKPHYDVGGITIQAYADAEGFWGTNAGPHSLERTHYNTDPGEAFLFLGIEHSRLYGKDSRLQPLWHGVDRIIPEGVSEVPRRHAVILFTDAPRIDYDVTLKDTLPHLYPDESTVTAPSKPQTSQSSQVA